jgi:hypothetical protein
MDADGIFSMLFCHKARSFLNVPVDGYYWWVRNGSVSSTFSLYKHIDRISNWHDFFEIISDLHENEITTTEKQYLVFLSHFIVEMTLNLKNTIKYRRFIKQEAKFAINMAKKFNVSLIKHIHTVSKAPISFSIASIIKRKLKK